MPTIPTPICMSTTTTRHEGAAERAQVPGPDNKGFHVVFARRRELETTSW